MDFYGEYVSLDNNVCCLVTNSDQDIVETARETKRHNASLLAFEKLRDCAIENICKVMTHEPVYCCLMIRDETDIRPWCLIGCSACRILISD